MLCKKQIYEYNNVYELILGDEAMGKVIGKVIATEKNPSTIDDFYFWTKQDTILNPFDVVKIGHLENSVSYGVKYLILLILRISFRIIFQMILVR